MTLDTAITRLEEVGMDIFPRGDGTYHVWDDVFLRSCVYTEEELIEVARRFPE